MRALFCPLESPGFLFPAVAIASRLPERGHAVAFATGQKAILHLADAGLDRLPRGPSDGRSFEVATWGSQASIALQLHHVDYALRRFPADVIVASELALGAILAAEVHDLPVAVLGLASFPWPALLVPPVSGDSSVRDDTYGHQHFLFTSRRELFVEARRGLALAATPEEPDDSRLLGDLHLVQGVPDLEPLSEAMPATTRFVGDCTWEPDEPGSDPELESFLVSAELAREPVLYVQLGRRFGGPSPWNAVRAAVERLAVRAVAVLGRSGLVELPPSSTRLLVRPHVRQSAVLRHAVAAIASGSSTVVLGALAHGLPLLLLPSGGEQPLLARACRHAGVGAVLDPDSVTVESMAREILRVVRDGSLRARATVIRRELEAAGGPAYAAELIEDLTTAGPAKRASLERSSAHAR